MTPEQLKDLISQCSEHSQNPPPPLPAFQPINPNLQLPVLTPLQAAFLQQMLLLQQQSPALYPFNLLYLSGLLQSIFLVQTPSDTMGYALNTSEDRDNDSGIDSPMSNISSPNFGTLSPLMQTLLQTPLLTQSPSSAFSSIRCPSAQSSSSSIFSEDLQKSVKSAMNTCVQAPHSTPIVIRKGRKDYCKVCKMNIFKNGSRSQGPRRHVLQHHLQRAYFLCTLCEFGSNYDKAHVHAHARNMHPNVNCKSAAIELPRWVYAAEEKIWMETCFGDDSDGTVSQELQNLIKVDKSEDIEKAKAEVMRDHRDGHETTSPLADFSMTRLLTPAPSISPEVDIKSEVQDS